MGRRLKSILVFVPVEGEPMAFRNFRGEHTKSDMLEIACEWIEVHPTDIVMYDDELLTPNEPEEGIIVDGLYVPPHMLYGRKGMKWGVRKK